MIAHIHSSLLATMALLCLGAAFLCLSKELPVRVAGLLLGGKGKSAVVFWAMVLMGLVGNGFAKDPEKETAPIVPFSEVISLIESLKWQYLKIGWYVDQGDDFDSGPTIHINRKEDSVNLIYHGGGGKSGKLTQRVLSVDQQRAICRKLIEFMAIAKKEVDASESLEGLSEKEQEARLRKIFGGRLPPFGISQFGYSVSVGRGGQTLSFGDAFSKTGGMGDWLRSLKDEPKASE